MGAEPGVYCEQLVNYLLDFFFSLLLFFRVAAEQAMGLLANPSFIRAHSQSAADWLFVIAYCAHQVACLV